MRRKTRCTFCGKFMRIVRRKKILKYSMCDECIGKFLQRSRKPVLEKGGDKSGQ